MKPGKRQPPKRNLSKRYVRCWTCEGSGVQPSILYLIPFWPIMQCRRCRGSGSYDLLKDKGYLEMREEK